MKLVLQLFSARSPTKYQLQYITEYNQRGIQNKNLQTKHVILPTPTPKRKRKEQEREKTNIMTLWFSAIEKILLKEN